MTFIEIDFIEAFQNLSEETFQTHIAKGWTEGSNPKDMNWNGNQIALMHSELSEGLEGLRKDLQDDKLPHRKMIEVELADTVIRIMNYAKQCGYDVAGAIIEKNKYNRTRPYKHGDKKF